MKRIPRPRIDPGPPWTPRTLGVSSAALLTGAVLLLGGWAGASGERSLADQMPWINLAAVGVVVAAGGVGFFVLAGRRAVGTRTRVLLGPGPSLTLPVKRHPDRASASTVRPPLVAVVGAGASWYHRPGCPLVAGKDVDVVRGQRPGWTACPACVPDHGHRGAPV